MAPLKPDTVRIREALASAAEEGANLDELVEVKLAGHAAWQTPPEAPGKAPGHANAYAGDTVTMPRREAIRLGVLGYIAGANPADTLAADVTPEEREDLEALSNPPAPPAGDASARATGDGSGEDLGDGSATPAGGLEAFLPGAGDGDPDASPLTADELAALGAPELVAHLGQFPGDTDRVLELELARSAGKRRSTVLEAAGMTAEEAKAATKAAS